MKVTPGTPLVLFERTRSWNSRSVNTGFSPTNVFRHAIAAMSAAAEPPCFENANRRVYDRPRRLILTMKPSLRPGCFW
jgi:hypothetical protein